MKSKSRLATVGFKLRKFLTNSMELHKYIRDSELLPTRKETEGLLHAEDDQSYAKTTLGNNAEETNKVLGVQWNLDQDCFQFDIGDVACAMESTEPTKRGAVSITSRFFNPLGVLAPVTILFKMFCQELCEAELGWDEPLKECFLQKWNQLFTMLKGARPFTIPRFLYHTITQYLKSLRLIGFCDASMKAYAAHEAPE